MAKKALCITIPKIVSWETYKQELAKVADGNCVMNYKVPTFPKEVKPGDRCYMVHNGFIKGWMTIFDIVDRDAFKCTTTGRNWAGGIYIQRTGKFHPLNPEVPMKGFMGYCYIDEIE